ncbi:Ig-like domain-containing protein [Aeromonas jandaei]|uniref:Ig-like domain-containing protein n=1 Tax=Aeromonas jandaei TaxID=650 RepID=UPI002B05E828|nr:Ig-like domain-containing protein [Aeromonas jandaei]
MQLKSSTLKTSISKIGGILRSVVCYLLPAYKCYLRSSIRSSVCPRHSFVHGRFGFFLTWLNVCVQAAMPIAVSFSPAIQANNIASVNKNTPSNNTLKHTDSLPDIGSQALPTSSSPFEEIANENAIASIAAEVGRVLSGPSPASSSRSQVVGIGERMANSAVQDMLSQYGTAKLTFNSKGEGAVDFLLPIFDFGESLYFTQLGYRVSKDRDIFNFGLGTRFFSEQSMIGLNTFYDQDLKGSSRRLGVGAEWWRDNLKLTANTYTPLSGWRQSPLASMQDYDERAAKGADVRLRGYLPSHPQLGASVSYEKYFGNEVALTSATERKRNPSALSYGLDYSPFPLLTVGFEQVHGSDKKATNFTAGLTYRLGLSLSEQLNRNASSASRSLLGSRFDLVDRNNNIVYEYRKQELIELQLSAQGQPYAGETMTISAEVTSKHGLQKIDWDATALIADGGAITPIGIDQLQVKLPLQSQSIPFRHADGQKPSYIIGAVATDKKGNGSVRATISIDTQRSPSDISSIALSKPTAVADGVDVIDVIVSAVDTDSGVPLASEPITLIFTNTTLGKAIKEETGFLNSNGKFNSTISTTQAGEVTVVAELTNSRGRSSATMQFVGDVSTAMLTDANVHLIADNAIANGKAENKVRIELHDTNGNILPGVPLKLAGSQGVSISGVVETGVTGAVEVPFSSIKAGAASIQVSVNGANKVVSSNFKVDDSSAKIIRMEIVTDNAVADGESENEILITVNDAFGSAVPGIELSFDVAANALIIPSGKTDENGLVRAAIRSIVAGPQLITATVNGKQESTVVSFVSDKRQAKLELTLKRMRSIAVADGINGYWLGAKLTDPKGNAISGETISFSLSNTGILSSSQAVTDAQGYARIYVSSSNPGLVRVDATALGDVTASAELHFHADLDTMSFVNGEVKLIKDGSVANGVEQNKAFVIVRDGNNEPVSDVLVQFTLNEVGSVRLFQNMTNADGYAEVAFSSTKSGIHQLSANAGGASASIGTLFVADTTTAVIAGQDTDFTVATGAVANGTEENVVSARVMDVRGNPVAGIAVSFAVTGDATLVASNVTTDKQGVARSALVSLVAGSNQVTATVGGKTTAAKESVFVADTTTAVIAGQDTDFTVATGAVANGSEENVVSARVTDLRGNPVAGMAVSFAVTGDATLVASNVTTDKQGVARSALVSLVAGSNQVTATVGGKTTAAKESVFVADTTTAVIAGQDTDFTVATGAVANGSEENVVSARVTDLRGNPVAGMAVSFAVTGDATLVASNVTTDKQGVARSALVSLVAGSNQVTATVGGKTTAAKESVFVADTTTAGMSKGELTVTTNNAKADGVATNAVKAVVRDAQGNPVSGVEVTFTVTNDAALALAKAATDANGEASSTLVNTKAGVSAVTATANGSSKSVDTTFSSDLAQMSVSVGYLSGPVYTEVSGAGSVTPIVGSTWKAQVTCPASILAADCDVSRFDFTWYAKGVDGVTRAATGATNSDEYLVPANEQRAQVWVEIAPKATAN